MAIRIQRAIPQLFASAETGVDPMRRTATSVGMPTASFMLAWKASNGAGRPPVTGS